jgi:hypothetical protein
MHRPRDTVVKLGKRLYMCAMWVLVGGCSFEASCGGRKLDTAKGEKLIADSLKQQSGVDAVVTCPRNVKLAKDTVTECDVKLGGVPGKARIVQTDGSGNVNWEMIEGYVLATRAEELYKGELAKRSGTEVTVDCGDRVRPSIPDTTFRCKVAPMTGTPYELEVRITSKTGETDAKVVQ